MFIIYTACPLSQSVPSGFYDASPASIKYLLNPTVPI